MLRRYDTQKSAFIGGMMDISSARLASLLKEAMTPQPVPLAKADPVRTALVRELVQPAAPSLFAQRTAPALLAMPVAPIAVKSQQIASSGIVEAYQAQLDTRDEAVLATVAARKAAPEADAQRGAVPPSATANDNAPARAAGVSLLSFVPPQPPLQQNTATLGAPAGRRIAANQSHTAAPNSEGLLVKIGFVSIMTGLLATMMFGFVLLLLR
ncbi:hypothetical protein CK231_26905 [Mesorhizobium loti]|nr:hypothetical protein MesloDRAFT_1359 [Mesorhizobium japonicum R7A]MUT22091.1 hypothetical protein [Mesorhizobium japonicum]PBB11014.1 hypothetical protein CK231_26905 [Mesorhizobium loti]MUT28488.1 hypothetical protein [Mesorhizobium japonicum]PBB47094.1 hypothetical protein CK213_24510 [Mesorhizobium loti]